MDFGATVLFWGASLLTMLNCHFIQIYLEEDQANKNFVLVVIATFLLGSLIMGLTTSRRLLRTLAMMAMSSVIGGITCLTLSGQAASLVQIIGATIITARLRVPIPPPRPRRSAMDPR